jgi:hypothetical protein
LQTLNDRKLDLLNLTVISSFLTSYLKIIYRLTGSLPKSKKEAIHYLQDLYNLHAIKITLPFKWGFLWKKN